MPREAILTAKHELLSWDDAIGAPRFTRQAAFRLSWHGNPAPAAPTAGIGALALSQVIRRTPRRSASARYREHQLVLLHRCARRPRCRGSGSETEAARSANNRVGFTGSVLLIVFQGVVEAWQCPVARSRFRTQMSIALEPHKIEIEANLRARQGKPLLRESYAGFHERIVQQIAASLPGRIVRSARLGRSGRCPWGQNQSLKPC